MPLNSGSHFQRRRDGGRHPPQKSFTKVLATSPPAVRTIHDGARRKKMRRLVDIDLKAPPRRFSPAVVATDSSAAKGANREKKVLEDDKERKRRRWEALLDVAAIAVIREYELSLVREDIEYRAEKRIRNPRKSCGGAEFVNLMSGRDRRWEEGGAGECAYDAETVVAPLPAPAPTPPPPVARSKRGRVVSLPNRYKHMILGAEEDFCRRGKSAAAAAGGGLHLGYEEDQSGTWSSGSG